LGSAHKGVTHLPELGARLVKLQEKDFAKCVDYFKSFKIDQNGLLEERKSLIRTAHSVAFTMSVFTNKLSNIPIPEWVVPYLSQLKSDTIQILPSAVLSARRTLHLYERASIEDFLRYIYFFDHKIEHILLQSYPKRFPSVDLMIDWLEKYPTLSSYRKPVSDNCSKLISLYAELSRTVHGTTLADQQIVLSLKDSSSQGIQSEKEERILKSVFRAIFFLMSAFHIKEYRSLQLDERTLVCQHFSRKETRVLSGLNLE
jgi:hypothetical protein